MAKPFGGKRPQNLRHTLRRFMDYLGRHKIMLGVVGLLAAVSALAALLGTYMIRPIVNGVLENGSAAYLAGVVALTAGIYIVGALSTLGYTQLMVRAAQKILQDIRRDLFAHLQTLPLHYFDTNRKGDLMSLFTNDVDTISDALNNSFAVVIQTFIQVAGTLLLLFVLNWRLSLLVVVGYIAMFWYINYSTQRSRAFYARQQASLGELDAYMEEMIAGQKVVKVFNHQQADMAAFAARNEKLREAGTGAQSYAATMIPAVVSIGYLNYAVIAVVGGLMVMWGWSDLGSLASYLVFVRQTTLPINQLTQQGNFLLAALAGAERIFAAMEQPVDLLMCNYVYEHVVDNTHHTVSYKSILPQDRVFAWDEIGHFPPSQNILMHTVIYRTQILRDSGLELPKHTFYVDNVFVYQPLPLCQRLYYMDIDLYRYFIGRDDQSVNESVMVKRVDQQLRVTKIMIDAVDLYALPERQKKLRAYMFNYLSMMMAISSVFLTMDGRPEAFEKKTELWQYLKNHDERVYNKCRYSVAGACNLPGTLGHKITLWGYHVAQKIFKFN